MKFFLAMAAQTGTQEQVVVDLKKESSPWRAAFASATSRKWLPPKFSAGL